MRKPKAPSRNRVSTGIALPTSLMTGTGPSIVSTSAVPESLVSVTGGFGLASADMVKGNAYGAITQGVSKQHVTRRLSTQETTVPQAQNGTSCACRGQSSFGRTHGRAKRETG